VEIATALATLGTALRRELMVDAKKQGEELRVLQQGMAHWGWSRFCGRKTLRKLRWHPQPYPTQQPAPSADAGIQAADGAVTGARAVSVISPSL
jgi:hypothetical protein